MAADKAHILWVADDVRCDPDLPLLDYLLPPPWAPPFVNIQVLPMPNPKVYYSHV